MNVDNPTDRVAVGRDDVAGRNPLGAGSLPSALERALQTGQEGEWLRLLSDPHPVNWRARMQAARSLAHVQLDPELANAVANTLVAVFDDDVPGDDRDEREASLQRRMLCGMLLGLAVCAGLWLSVVIDAPEHELGSWVCVLVVILGCAASVPLWRALLLDLEDYRVRRLQRAVAHALCRLKIPRTVGALAVILRRYPRLHAEAEAAFVVSAAGLTADHYGTLPPNTVPQLCTLLTTVSFVRNETVDLHCLLALERVGNARAIPHVKAVVARGRTARLREAATAALAALEQRRRLETDRHLLVRGTTSPLLEPSLLLRSTSGTEQPDQMLRSVGPQPEGDTELLLRSHPQP